MSPANHRSSIDFAIREKATRDAELVRAAQAGSSAAFAELQRIYSRPLYNTIMRITKNKEDAEDALQDSFLRVFLSLCRFEGRSTFYSWLTRIGVNSALMICRRRRYLAEVSFELPATHRASLSSLKSSSVVPTLNRPAISVNDARKCSRPSRTSIRGFVFQLNCR